VFEKGDHEGEAGVGVEVWVGMVGVGMVGVVLGGHPYQEPGFPETVRPTDRPVCMQIDDRASSNTLFSVAIGQNIWYSHKWSVCAIASLLSCL